MTAAASPLAVQLAILGVLIVLCAATFWAAS